MSAHRHERALGSDRLTCLLRLIAKNPVGEQAPGPSHKSRGLHQGCALESALRWLTGPVRTRCAEALEVAVGRCREHDLRPGSDGGRERFAFLSRSQTRPAPNSTWTLFRFGRGAGETVVTVVGHRPDLLAGASVLSECCAGGMRLPARLGLSRSSRGARLPGSPRR